MNDLIYPSPDDAENAFYDAFERADLRAMMKVWADDDSIVCIHPMGPSLHGRQAVEESWRHVFNGGVPMRLAISDGERTHEQALSIHIVHENIRYGQDYSGHTVVLATNVYKLTASGWRMIVHHASPTGVPRDQPPDTDKLH